MTTLDFGTFVLGVGGSAVTQTIPSVGLVGSSIAVQGISFATGSVLFTDAYELIVIG